MNRIDQRFADLRARRRPGLIPFVTAGDPQPEATVAVMHALAAAGADLIELGVPFSDPMADGPVIQRASERALARGVGLARVLEMVSAFRGRDRATPVVLMGYLNPVECYGRARFVRDAAAAGVDGLLLVDAPPEEDDELIVALADAGIARILLVAPTTGEQRVAWMAPRARGFVYYVSFAGITGADRLAHDAVRERIAALRRHVQAPIAVGFGIKDAQQAAALATVADAVVIGSALVEALAEARDPADAAARAAAFLAPIRAALDGVRAATAA